MKTKLEIINEQLEHLVKSYPFFHYSTAEIVNNHINFHQWFVTTDSGSFDVFDLSTLMSFADRLHLVPSVFLHDDKVTFEMYIFL